jgi:cob(I)alamin adenosyltransferase
MDMYPAERSLLVVFTGDGKGKTTAALGVLLRAWGRDLRVVMVSFIKARSGNWGEQQAARKMGVEVIATGRGFTWLSDNPEEDKALAEEGWRLAREKISSGVYDVVILDEFTFPLSYGWLPLEEALDFLTHRPERVSIIVTGRDAPQPLIEAADLVTEMREVKHPYSTGVEALPGIDF